MSDVRLIAALIVIFNPDYLALKRLIKRLDAQTGKIFIVNNNEKIDASYANLRKESNPIKIEFIEMNGNAGMARALNRGLEAAHSMGYPVCWTFDQDSLPGASDGYRLYSAFKVGQKKSKKIAAVAPLVYNINRSEYLPYILPSAGNTIVERRIATSQEVGAAITSGMMINLHAWKISGGMNETYFIDLVDTEWCFRMRSQGFVIRCEATAKLEHKLGAKGHKNAFLRIGAYRQRPQKRTYYIVRNIIALGGASYAPTNWPSYGAQKIFRLFFAGIVAGPGRLGQLIGLLRGIIDGLRLCRTHQ